jgi:hypothetical protein
MRDGAIVRYWRLTLDAVAELACVDVDGTERPLHLHEEWQFGVPESPSRLSLGAFRRYSVDIGDVTVDHAQVRLGRARRLLAEGRSPGSRSATGSHRAPTRHSTGTSAAQRIVTDAVGLSLRTFGRTNW